MVLDDVTYEAYVPQIGDNRTKAAAGDPEAVTVQVRGASALIWRRYLRGLARRAEGNGAAPAEEEVEGVLFLGCIGRITGLRRRDGTVIPDGVALWALRDAVLDRELFNDLFGEIARRSQVDGTLAGNSAPGSGSSDSIPSTPGTTAGGTAATADAAA